ncbi:hypothetical protein OsI_20123 [Oryza sativa Indica Group]|uniref:GIR1-like zinc ribbon domain-containing protein n=1 Tax=Oryza sativa subsp. indica TaxID=39946 RepID=A2Y552_ORYSI|nr:hypothetical protein OsI_20123 [Oryza sativa Indica Group]
MSRNNGGKGGKLQEARVNLPSTARGRGDVVGGGGREQLAEEAVVVVVVDGVAAELVRVVGGEPGSGRRRRAAGGSSGMILAGCPRCMMYVMLSREDPSAPVHSTVLLDFNDAAAAADPRQVGAGKSKGKHRG